jgi:hypothetical protein
VSGDGFVHLHFGPLYCKKASIGSFYDMEILEFKKKTSKINQFYIRKTKTSQFISLKRDKICPKKIIGKDHYINQPLDVK